MNRRGTSLWVALIFGILGAHPVVASTFLRGDVNADSSVDMADALRILDILFVETTRPDCLDAMDANDDGGTDLSDSVYVLVYLFRGGLPPVEPYPECGEDPTPDDLDCEAYSECVECETVAEAEAAIAGMIPRLTCVPADGGVFEFSTFLGPLIITVCPRSEATLCGEEQQPGCGVGIDTVDVELDLIPPVRTVVFRVSGSAVDLPVTVGSTDGGTAVVCSITLPFSVEVSMALVVADAGDGAVEVVALGAPSFDEITVDVSATGGPICNAIVGVKDLIIDELNAQAEDIAASVLEEATGAVVGRVICLE